MIEFLRTLAEKSNFMPHGQCYYWNTKLLWLNVGSDILTVLAYYAIAGFLVYFIVKRRDVPFIWVFVLFGAFIFACGSTHLMGAWTVYVPSYWEQGVIKLVNACISAVTAVVFIYLMPRILTLPNLQRALDENTQLNSELQLKVTGLEIEIEKRVEAEDKSSLSEERLRLQREQTPLGAIEWNTNLEIVDWNPAAEKIFGYSKEEALGQNISDLTLPEGSSLDSDKIINHLLSNTGGTHSVNENSTKDGKIILCEWHNTALIDNKGTMVGLFSIVEDVTIKRQQESQLQQAQKMEAVGQLTGGIAHDFNNLLSIISGNLRFLKNDIGETSDEIDELFEDAISATADGAELTQRLLGFSRTKLLHPETKDVNDTITQSVRFLSRTLADNTELEMVLPDETLFINVDPSQLENALLNLSINARDAMPKGGTITISAERCPHGHIEGLDLPEGDYVKISVIDTGSGISPEDLHHVYEPFFTTKDVGKGSGLGLSMVFGFTQQSQGGCHIDSTPGEGTTVSMYFPEVMDDENIDEEPEDKEKLSSNGSKVILVVEDEPRVRRVALRDLKMLGYQTLEAENADIAKTIIESGEPIDLLFSDILMPGEMDGHMLAIWTEEHYPQIKIVLTSGYSKAKKELREDEARRFPLLRKPYAIEKLAEQISTTLEE